MARISVKRSKGADAAPVVLTETRPTSERILDAAEILFGHNTFDTVSTRDIGTAAGVNLALLTYHFGTKEALFERIVARRAELLGKMRQTRLAALRASSTLTLETILDCFMRPLLEMLHSRDPGWESYVLLLSQIGQSNRWQHLLVQYFDDTARLFLAALREVTPGLDEVSLQRGFHFTLVIMLALASGNRRLEALSRGTLLATDIEAAYPPLLTFAVSGFRGLEQARVAGDDGEPPTPNPRRRKRT
ncbi:TetR family transcriptional regulator [Roseomonas mucosa]|uniref:TetR/AcrR family transcriptional regulator n=1 Tax=Roseomonas mucosa TaxID=207340 RepID=UPI00384BE78F